MKYFRKETLAVDNNISPYPKYGRELFVLYPTLGPVHTGLVESSDGIKIWGSFFWKKKAPAATYPEAQGL